MCELFGLSSNQALQPRELLCRFGAHGGGVADNPDGWGLAWIEGASFHIEKEPRAAAHSARFRELCASARAPLILGHVRKANPPTARVAANTHPFRRVCCGREWVFAHNGVIPDHAKLGAADSISPCVPGGDTDSEHAFCLVLERIATSLSVPHAVHTGQWLDTLAAAAEMLASHGRFNFLMSDGLHLIAYGHDRLWSLADGSAANSEGTTEIAVVATEPLTDASTWSAFEPGELRVYRAGRRIAHFITRPLHLEPGAGAAPSAQTVRPRDRED
ncbi:MAG: class II glutamine amidotransferase [Gammaproteobacteria bacterium]|nr:class II glutamine amidotransferase [Gammaproteobacteria bacterium]